MRLIYFILIVIGSVVLPWWFVLPLWLCYAFAFRAYELIALGVFLDACFGYQISWHVLYTLVAVALCVGAEFLKPRIAFYSREGGR